MRSGHHHGREGDGLLPLRPGDSRPGQARHVGDRWEADIRGAVAAGMRAAWITPHPASPQ
ncbi:MAG: HAD hydrolase-like protein [Pseudomonadota bacterium]